MPGVKIDHSPALSFSELKIVSALQDRQTTYDPARGPPYSIT